MSLRTLHVSRLCGVLFFFFLQCLSPFGIVTKFVNGIKDLFEDFVEVITPNEATPPDVVDWVAAGKITPVKDQKVRRCMDGVLGHRTCFWEHCVASFFLFNQESLACTLILSIIS